MLKQLYEVSSLSYPYIAYILKKAGGERLGTRLPNAYCNTAHFGNENIIVTQEGGGKMYFQMCLKYVSSLSPIHASYVVGHVLAPALNSLYNSRQLCCLHLLVPPLSLYCLSNVAYYSFSRWAHWKKVMGILYEGGIHFYSV